MNKEQKINDVEVKLDKDGQLYYYGKEFEIIRWDNNGLGYKVYLNGKEIKKVISVEFKLQIGESPIIRLEIIE